MNTVPENWIAIPKRGAWVSSSHPITIANPDSYFMVFEISEGDRDSARYFVRGVHTIWFALSMISPKPDAVVIERHGFDITQFKSAEDFSKLCDLFDCQFIGQDRENHDCFIFGGRKLTIRTTCNPITGVYHRPEHRGRDPGFAAFIGITGDKEYVDECVAWIQMNAEYIKGESPGKCGYI